MSTKHAEVSSEGSKSCRGEVPQYYGNEQQQPVLWRAPGLFEIGDDEGEEDDDDDNSDRTTSTTAGGDQYSQQGEAERGLEAEPMFEKPLTPSDVGKLNRLVIPKQYAERYLPLAGGNGGDSKALHLCFEDESGKPWRFRYSYWNSSQSYVLTKGWSRYVKEKRLDAGDVVSFHRRAGDQGLSIRWRRRRIPRPDVPGGGAGPSSGPTVLWAPLSAARPAQYPSPTTLVYVSDEQEQRCPLRDHAGEQMFAAKQPPPLPPANSKRLRLFGVNLDCPSEDHLMPDPTKLNGPHYRTQTQGHRTPALFHDSTTHSP